jgi:hypothetical protein
MNRRNKLLTNDQIEDLLDISFGSDEESGEEDGFAEFSDHNLESVQSIGEYESESERGSDDFGLTCSESTPHSRTEQHNIIRFKSGSKLKAVECQKILQVFLKFLTDNFRPKLFVPQVSYHRINKIAFIRIIRNNCTQLVIHFNLICIQGPFIDL